MRLPSTSQILVSAALSLVGTVALASSVTYNFKGTVDSESGSFRTSLTAGEQVSGSFTIDVDAAIPGQGQSGSTDSSYWYRASYGGTVENLPVPAALVFTENVTVNGVTYDASTLSPTLDSATLGGNSGGLYGRVAIRTPDGIQNELQVSLLSNSNAFAAYLSNGLVNLDTVGLNIQSSGLFQAYANNGVTEAETGQFGFVLTSLTAASTVPPGGTPVPLLPTPLPAAAWLLLSGMALLRTLPKRIIGPA